MKPFSLLLLVTMLLLGCVTAASTPRKGVPVVISVSSPSKGLGILLDEKQVVQSLDFPARNYDIKVGDKLIDLRPLSDIEELAEDAVSFTDTEAIRNSLEMANQDIYVRGKSDSVFVIRLEREGSTKEVEITVGVPGSGPEAKATVTPAPMEWFYY
jgi:hypothetical protein